MELINKENQQAAERISNNEAQLFAMDNLDAIKYLMAAVERFREGENSDDWECDLGRMLFGERKASR